MRIYLDENKKEPIAVICNKCKKELKVENGDAQFGYFSKKDGMRYSFDLCEDCFDKMLKGFAIPAEEAEVTEYM